MDWNKVYEIVRDQWCPQYDSAVNMMGTWVPVAFAYATHYSLFGAMVKASIRDGLVRIDIVSKAYCEEWIEWSRTASQEEVLRTLRRRIECDNYQLN